MLGGDRTGPPAPRARGTQENSGEALTWRPTNPSGISIDEAKALAWLGKGAQPSGSVLAVLKRAGVWAKHLESKAPKAPAAGGAGKAPKAKAPKKAPAPSES